MALTDRKPLDTPSVAALGRAPAALDAPAPFNALAQLPRLHGEASRNFGLTQFLGRSPQACVTLMLAGSAMLTLSGGTLKGEFAWAVLVLLGVVAMTRNFIRGFARSLRRVPLEEAASDLRVLLLYTGAAWGSGAFLVMPTLPAPLLSFGFAIVPALVLALILKDRKGIIAFTVPAALITAGAAVMGAWPLDIGVGLAIVIAAAGIISLSALQQTPRPPVLTDLALR
ncbi:MAG: hypothetical protein V4601_05810 [Pseudomonadota bacterium]